jgi:hypothetical protein
LVRRIGRPLDPPYLAGKAGCSESEIMLWSMK